MSERYSSTIAASEGRAVLGVDAAWTSKEPSGVALAIETGGGWQLAAVEASYDHFIERANGDEPGEKRPVGRDPPVAALLEAAYRISGRPVDLVAVDMPLSRRPIISRRFSDNRISAEFGSFGAGTHSPSDKRPGPLSDKLTKQFDTLNYRLCTSEPAMGLIEVYPHTALIRFLNESYRLEYKATKIRRYWPNPTSAEDRSLKLRMVWARIVEALDRRIANVGARLLAPEAKTVAWRLKAFEDKLDAVVCCAVGIACLNGEAEAFGDEDAAIWVPAARLMTARRS